MGQFVGFEEEWRDLKERKERRLERIKRTIYYPDSRKSIA